MAHTLTRRSGTGEWKARAERVLTTEKVALTEMRDLTLEGQQLHVLEGHTESVKKVAFSPDGRFLASCGREPTVRVWNPANGGQLWALTGHTDHVWTVAFSSDSSSTPHQTGDLQQR